MPIDQFMPARGRGQTWLVAVVGIGLACWLSAGAQTISRQLPQPTGDASVQGVVTDGVSREPIAEARVAVLGRATVNTTTDAQGAFEIANLPAGAYSLLVDVPGRGSDRYGQLRPDGGATGINLEAGQHLQNVKLLSWPRATVSGRVTTPNGDPVSGATVEVARRVFTLASYVEDFTHQVFVETDTNGQYRTQLAAGHYLVTVRSTNVTIPASVQDAFHQEIATPSIGRLVTDRLQLSAAPVITGRGFVVGEYRYQIMTLRQEQSPGVRPSVAGVTSTYLSKAREIDLRAGDQSSLDFSLALAPAFSVSGVVEGSKGGALVAVRLTSLTEPAMMQFSTGPPLSSETAIGITDAKGAFTMLGVPAGRYEAFVRVGIDGPLVPPAQRHGTTESARAEVSVTAADVKGLTLTLRPSPTVAGQIAFVGDPPPTSEQKAMMSFGLYEDLLSSTPKPNQPFIRADGTFQLSGLVPGRYWPTAALGDWSVEHITINGQSYDDRAFLLDEDVSGVNVVATRWKDRKGVLWGRLNLAPGMDPADVTIAVFPANYAERIAGGNLNARRILFRRVLKPDFNFGAFPPGPYFIVAYREADGQDPTKAFFDRLARRATPIVLRDGTPTRVVLDVADITR